MRAPPAAVALAPTAADAADHAVRQALLRCWVRELGVPVDGPVLTLRIGGRHVEVPVLATSATGWHRFGHPHSDGAPVGAARLADLVGDELVAAHGMSREAGADLVDRMLESLARIEDHVTLRARETLPSPTFLACEQELVAGHPFHPSAKSRDGLRPPALEAASPELRGSFRLRWLAVDRELVTTGSALERSTGTLLDDLDDAPVAPAGTTAVPLHPWQAERLMARQDVAALLGAGGVRDLGCGRGRWHPTSSLRTVLRPGAPWMLKLSLGLRVTNARRDNKRSELRLGEQAHRLLAAGVGADLAAAHPRFHVITDPAWMGVDLPGAGFELALRHNPFPADAPVACVAALVDERPGCGGPLLVALLRRVASASGRPLAEMALEWLRRYVEEVVWPLAWLDARCGIVLEAHHQNTLVSLDGDGFPAGGWYRDSQGWYVARSRAAELRRRVPALGDGVEAVFADELVAERGAYYLGVNNLLGLVGCLAAAGVASEEALLAELAGSLERAPRGPVVEMLLSAPTLPCKANLLTCADGRDELTGPVEQQSVYVQVRNPIPQARR